MPAEHAQQVEIEARDIRAWLLGMPAQGRSQALEDAAASHGDARKSEEIEGARRNRGTWYTPPALVACVLDAALTAKNALSGRVCDPACGAGHFLVEAARRMLAAGRPRGELPSALFGCDVDPRAVALTRARLAAATGSETADWAAAIRCGDALAPKAWLSTSGEAMTFDVVVGNPPFLNQVKRRSAATRAEARAVLARFNGAVAGLADSACAFLLLAAELSGARGRLALVLPMSLVAASDAAATRRALGSTHALVRCLVPPTRVFGGGVPTIVLVAEGVKARVNARAPRGECAARAGCVVERVLAADRTERVDVPAELLASGAWSPLLAALRGVPRVGEVRGAVVEARVGVACASGARLADIASATADFRQHFYGLRGHVSELNQHREPGQGGSPLLAGERPAMPSSRSGAAQQPAWCAVATVGSIDRAECTWGVRPVRLHGMAFAAPVADLVALRKDPMLDRWVRERLVPKVIVATQTRIIEAWVDEHGAVLPSTPLVSVTPHRLANLWHVAAVLLAPATSATAWWRHAGAALSPGALKLSASQMLELPLPTNTAAWNRGAERLKQWQASPGDQALEQAFAHDMNAAYEVGCSRVGGRPQDCDHSREGESHESEPREDESQVGEALAEWWLKAVASGHSRQARAVFC